MNSKKWYELAEVLGQGGQQVLIKNASTYIKVHPCCLQLIQNNDYHKDSFIKETDDREIQKQHKSQKCFKSKPLLT